MERSFAYSPRQIGPKKARPDLHGLLDAVCTPLANGNALPFVPGLPCE